MKTITIISKDEAGLLADISYILANEKINIETLAADAVGDKAIITLGIKDEAKARAALAASGYTVSDENAVVVKLKDEPGELSKITSMLAGEKINITNVFVLSRDGHNTIISFAVDNTAKAKKLLENYVVSDKE